MVPSGAFSKRNAAVVSAVKRTQDKFNKFLGESARDVYINGFWANTGKHMGTHRNKYLIKMGEVFDVVDSTESAVAALETLRELIESGIFLKR